MLAIEVPKFEHSRFKRVCPWRFAIGTRSLQCIFEAINLTFFGGCPVVKAPTWEHEVGRIPRIHSRFDLIPNLWVTFNLNRGAWMGLVIVVGHLLVEIDAVAAFKCLHFELAWFRRIGWCLLDIEGRVIVGLFGRV